MCPAVCSTELVAFMGPGCCVGGSLLNSTEDGTRYLRMRLPLLSLTPFLAASGSHLGAGAPPSSGLSEGLVGSGGSVRKWRVSPSPHSSETAAEDLSFLSCQLEERAEQIRSKSHLIQVEREKMQMELSHKRARVELERAASTSARNYEVGSGGCAQAWPVVGSKSPPAGAQARCLPGPPRLRVGSQVCPGSPEKATRGAGCRACVPEEVLVGALRWTPGCPLY